LKKAFCLRILPRDYRFAMASLGWQSHPKVYIIPERVGPTNSIELFRNGATAKKSLPKRIYN